MICALVPLKPEVYSFWTSILFIEPLKEEFPHEMMDVCWVFCERNVPEIWLFCFTVWDMTTTLMYSFRLKLSFIAWTYMDINHDPGGSLLGNLELQTIHLLLVHVDAPISATIYSGNVFQEPWI